MRTLKKALCIVLALVMAVGLLTVAAGAKSLGDYSDADKVSDEYALAVDANTQLGVLRGMTDATYEPQGTLNRAQLATIIYRIVTGDVEDKYVANYANAQRFSDVPLDAWFAGYVNYCGDNGYLKGVGDGKYDPAGTLTGYQAMAALLRAIGYDKNHEYEGTDWYVAVTKDAAKINKGIKADWAQPISREVTAQLAWNTLVAAPVMWVAALGDYVGLPGDYAAYAGVAPEPISPIAGTFGLVPLLYSVFGADYSEYDITGENPAYVLYDEDDNALVTLPIEAIKTYNTKIAICDMLVDAGIPKSSTATKAFTLYQNGARIGTDPLTHKDLACEDTPDLHGQGVVTKLFDLSKLQNLGLPIDRSTEGAPYLVAQTWYYLAQVVDVKDDAHGSQGATTLKVWCQGAGKDPIEVTVATKAYAVGTWLIVHDNAANGPAIRPQTLAKAINEAPEFARVYMPTKESKFVIDYEPTTVTGVLKDVTDNIKEAKVTFKIDKKDYDLNIDYYMSAAMGDTNFKGRTFTFFLDKFGNIIGDTEVFSATNYAVVDRIAYSEQVLDNAYAVANIVYMDATKAPAYKITKIDGEAVKNAEANGGAVALPNILSNGWEDNAKWEAPLYIIDGSELTPIEDMIEKAEFTKGQIQITDGESAIYANSKTVFLYRTGDRGNYEYASYTGVAKAPSFNNSTVYYVLAKDSKFAEVVFVADTSEAAGSAMDLIIPADITPDKIVYIGSNPDQIPVATYTVYDLQGNEVEVQVKGADLQDEFEALDAGLYNVKFDAEGYVAEKEDEEGKPDVTSLTDGDDSKYAAVTIEAGDEFDGQAFIDTSADPNFMYNFDGAKVIVIGDDVTTATLTADTSAKLAKYFGEGYMFYVLKAEADKEAYSVVYIMEAGE